MRDEFFRFGHFFDPKLTSALFLCVERCVMKEIDRRPVLSVDLRTETEIDQAIKELIEDLQLAGKEAKEALRMNAAKRSVL